MILYIYMEQWKKISGYDKEYEVSSTGLIRTSVGKNKRWFIMKPTPKNRNSGYLRLRFLKNSNKITLYVHRIVAQAFIPNPNNKPQVNHKNGIKSDNRAENLEWCTSKENNHHWINEIQKHRKDRAVRIIKSLKKGLSVRAISKQEGVSWGLVSFIKRGVAWKNIAR